MRKTIVTLMLACAGQMFAGGFWLQLGNPEANPAAGKMGAVVTIKAVGCHDPATAKVTATAVGVVNGERRTIPLELKPLGEPGAYALSQQWPKEGKWVIQLVGKNGEQFTNTLIGAGPDRHRPPARQGGHEAVRGVRCRSYAEIEWRSGQSGYDATDADAARDHDRPTMTTALVRAAAEGDRGAFGELYVRYARMVHGILLARVPPGDAEDLVQEVFLSAMKQLRGLRTAAAFRGWLAPSRAIAPMDHFRRRSRTTPLELVERAAPRAAAAGRFPGAGPDPQPAGGLSRDADSAPGGRHDRAGDRRADRSHAGSVRVNLCRGMKMLRELLEAK